jgi:hypothetical protein
MLNTLQDILKDAYRMERNELDLKLYTWQLFSGLYHLRKVNHQSITIDLIAHFSLSLPVENHPS